MSIAERAEGPWHTEYVTDKNGLPISFPKCRLTDVCPFREGQRTLFLDASDRKMRELRKPHNPNITQPPFIINPDHLCLGEVDDSKAICRIAEQQIWLRTVVHQTNHGQGELGDFFYSYDGEDFVYAGRAQIPDMARFRGNRIGLFTCNDEEESGYVEFRDVIYRNAVI